MKIPVALLKERKWAFGLIFTVLFFNPLFYGWAGDVSLKDKCLSWLICLVTGLALSGFDLFFKKRGEKIYLSLLFLLALAPNIIVWSYLYLSDLYMKRDMFWVIFNSNVVESTEYVQQFITWPVFSIGILYLGLGIFFILKARAVQSVSRRKHPLLFLLPPVIVLMDISLQYLSQAIPMLEFYKSYLLFRREYGLFEKEKALRMQLTMDIHSHWPDSTRHVLVVILGESTTVCHMGLYGYFRETTPFMERRRGELDIYTDVVTSDTHTYGVMQKALTFASHKHPEYYKQKASVVELFNAAGFKTSWIANNPILDKWGASYGVVAQQAGTLYDVSLAKKPDEIVLPSLRKILNEDGNKLIFIHLLGSHHAYRSRYPETYDYYDHKRDNELEEPGFRDTHMKQTIDEYDNSIRYGDFVYEQILREVEKIDASSCVLFFSDHGEEVYDTRNASGHHMSNVYPCQCRIPFILWRSEKYREENSEIVVDTARPYSIEDVIYSISTLGKLDYVDNDRTLSIFTKEYVAPAKRMVGKEDFEDILKKTRK
ncbi:MAG: sulfatase-like hydrolase/transferase [Tannerella sp.]|jgi:heptose-I-phosphate ethanolaminephosphotransferase|nr:sulfatase-like hydrolase/transferase [Tannerella sp.]